MRPTPTPTPTPSVPTDTGRSSWLRALAVAAAVVGSGFVVGLPVASAQDDPATTGSTSTTVTTPADPGPAPAPTASSAPSIPEEGRSLPAPPAVTGEPLDGGVALAWTTPDADPPVLRYVIRRDGSVVARVGAAQTAFTDAGLVAEQPFTYTVAAVNAVGQGPPSAAVTVVPSSDSTPGFTSTGGPEAQTERRVFTYSIASRGRVRSNLDHFAIHVAHTLNDPRGWALGGSIEFRQVRSGGHFTVWLAEAATVPSFSSSCSANWSCRVGRNVVINDTRWRQATPSWLGSGGSIDSYQHYVVIHETGHWLGFGHSNCPGPGQPAPTMQQQSISLQGCRHNGWPTGPERSTLSARTGAPAWPIGPDSASTVWGQVGDQVLACDWNGDGVDTQGVFRNGTWYVRDSLTGGQARSFTFGRAGDTAVCGDWDGRGGDGIGVVRGGRWFLRNTARAGVYFSFMFGNARAQPVAGDWDGDGRDGIGRVYRGKWKLRNPAGAGPVQWRLTYGRPGDQFVPGDWDGDGIDEPGVVRGASWFMPASWWPGSGGLVVRYGSGAAISGRWDGLAVDKPGRFNSRLWFFRRFSPTP